VKWKLDSYGVPWVEHDDASYASAPDKVTLITMHSAKGLEFPLVIIPSAQKVRQAAKTDEQEAKLLYVDMTRATQELVICAIHPPAKQAAAH
jgi:superfamily I DNA/RNA helicase